MSKNAEQVLSVRWYRQERSTVLARGLQGMLGAVQGDALDRRIEDLAARTNQLGPQPLWEGYRSSNIGGPTRLPGVVRTAARMGRFYRDLVRFKRPGTVVEFGAAFGVSGMYFLAGLMDNAHGRLWTYKPNKVWARIAQGNLQRIGDRFTLTMDTFEASLDRTLPVGENIDLAFIDAIHTREFVMPQLALVAARCNPGALIILDDLAFSAEMKDVWKEISADTRFRAAVQVGNRVGIVEMPSD